MTRREGTARGRNMRDGTVQPFVSRVRVWQIELSSVLEQEDHPYSLRSRNNYCFIPYKPVDGLHLVSNLDCLLVPKSIAAIFQFQFRNCCNIEIYRHCTIDIYVYR